MVKLKNPLFDTGHPNKFPHSICIITFLAILAQWWIRLTKNHFTIFLKTKGKKDTKNEKSMYTYGKADYVETILNKLYWN